MLLKMFRGLENLFGEISRWFGNLADNLGPPNLLKLTGLSDVDFDVSGHVLKSHIEIVDGQEVRVIGRFKLLPWVNVSPPLKLRDDD